MIVSLVGFHDRQSSPVTAAKQPDGAVPTNISPTCRIAGVGHSDTYVTVGLLVHASAPPENSRLSKMAMTKLLCILLDVGDERPPGI